MHPRKKAWFAKFNILGGVAVEKRFGDHMFAKDAIKAAFKEGLVNKTGEESFIVYAPSQIVSVNVECREVDDDAVEWHHRGPRWMI